MKAARRHRRAGYPRRGGGRAPAGRGGGEAEGGRTGICGSDLHEYPAGPIFIPVERDHALGRDRAPITIGHECCGEVTEPGAVLVEAPG